MKPKQISIILHLYQPSVQTASVFKQIFETTYQPLLKLLKTNKNANFTLNIPLSLLEIMDSYGHHTWLDDVSKLVETGKISLVGSGAYHPLLTRCSEKLLEDQVVLNEYGLGYYFGKQTGFEGEKSIMLKDVRGFFPPELAVDSAVLKTLSTLGYSWVLVDECALATDEHVSRIMQFDDQLKLVVRNTELSNELAFARSFDPAKAVDLITHSSEHTLVIALDGETFGHHNKEGILYLDTLLDTLSSQGWFFCTVEQLLSTHEASESAQHVSIRASSWGASKHQVQSDDALPFWVNKSNTLQQSIWELNAHVQAQYDTLSQPNVDIQNLENIAFWKTDVVSQLESAELQKYLYTKMAYLRLLASDFLWWASKAQLYTKEIVFSKELLLAYCDLATTVASMTNDDKLSELTSAVRQNI